MQLEHQEHSGGDLFLTENLGTNVLHLAVSFLEKLEPQLEEELVDVEEGLEGLVAGAMKGCCRSRLQSIQYRHRENQTVCDEHIQQVFSPF